MTHATPPLDVLIVEDEPLIAMDIQFMIEDAGHNVINTAASLREVTALPEAAVPDVAFVDIQLAEGSSGLDVNTLIQERWPDTIIVFVTANPKKIPEDFGGAHGVIAKPFSSHGFMAALQYLQEGVGDPPPVSPQPGSFVASPRFAEMWKH